MHFKPEQLEMQIIKYRNRNGWNHRDMLRVNHVKPWSDHSQNVFKYVTVRDAGKDLSEDLFVNLPVVQAFEQVSKMTNGKDVAKFLHDDEHNLPWEALSTDVLKSPEIWKVLIPTMGLTALIRNLGRISSLGIGQHGGFLDPHIQKICERLTSEKELHKARIHPFSVLLALYTYKQGHGSKGSLSWNVNAAIAGALESAFYLSFKNVEPTNKNYFIGLDISGSMTSPVNDDGGISCREASAALAMIIKRTEKNCETFGFSDKLTDLKLTASESLDHFVRKVDRLPFSYTDASLAINYALRHRVNVDVFVIITDNEVNAGSHPSEALKEYRKKVNPNAKLAVLAMTATQFSIADPNDSGMLDMTGLDASIPQILATFAKGWQ